MRKFAPWRLPWKQRCRKDEKVFSTETRNLKTASRAANRTAKTENFPPMQLIFDKSRPGRTGSTLPKLDVPPCDAVPDTLRRSRPAPLPEGVIERLRECEDAGGLHTPASLMVLAPGTRLRIVGGAFDDHVGVFGRMSADSRVVLMLSLLGRTVQVSLPRSAVDAA
mgnify:CR=1 FL=1